MNARILCVFGLLILLPAQPKAAAQQAKSPLLPAIFHSGERLQYRVTWSIFRIGTIVMTSERLPRKTGEKEEFQVTLILRSNPDIPFVSVFNRYEVVISTSPIRVRDFLAYEVQGSDTVVTRYSYIDSLDQAVMEVHTAGSSTIKERKVKEAVGVYYEGASMIFLARSLIHRDTAIVVPTMVEFEIFKTDINFTNATVPVSIDAVPGRVMTKEVYGKANFEGKTLAGFSGAFRGWFSDDAAAIPVRAEMNITLGTVILELERWTRYGWQPPTLIRRR